MSSNRKILPFLVALTAFMAGGASPPALSQSNEIKQFDIAPQSLESALLEFSEKAGLQLVVASKSLEGVESPGFRGAGTAQRVLAALMEGIDLRYNTIGATVTITDDGAGRQKDTDSGRDPDNGTQAKENLEASEPEAPEEDRASLSDTVSGEEQAPLELPSLTVRTGSMLISDASKLTRHTTIFSREEIELSGVSRLHEFLARLPGNINTPNNVGAGNFLEGQNFGLGKNLFAGNSVNLRGLGAQYTLLLIDGRRPTKGGQFGDIFDVSNIPLNRVARIEILYDGAAAIYGADAVGGVINIITDRDYEGTSLAATHETTEDGGGGRFSVNLGHTFNWLRGSLTIDLAHESQDGIDGAQRDIRFINSLPVAPGSPGNVGFGIDRVVPSPLFYVKDIDGDGQTTSRTGIDPDFAAAYDGHFGVPPGFFSSLLQGERIRADLPGIGFSYELFALFSPGGFLNPTDFGYTPVYQAGVPSGYTGAQPLSIYDFDEGFPLNELPLQRGYSLTPEDKKNSISIAVDHDLTDVITFAGTLTYGQTEKFVQTSNGVQLVTIGSPDAFPRAVNPFGVSAAYSLFTNLPQQSQMIDQESNSMSASIGWQVNEQWHLNFSAGYSSSTNESISINSANSSLFNFIAAGGRRKFDGGQLIVEEPDPSLNIFAPELGFASREAYLAQALLDGTAAVVKSRSADTEIRLQGSLFELPAGNLLSAIAAGYRREDTRLLSDISGLRSTSISLGIPEQTGFQTSDFDEDFGDSAISLAAELVIPIADSVTRMFPGSGLLLNVQARAEDYSNIEDNEYNWAVGFNWEHTEWFTTRWNRSYSVRVPAAVRFAREENLRRSALSVYDESRLSIRGFLPVHFLTGAAPGLRPERNYLQSLSFIFKPLPIPGLEINLNLYASKTVDQIRQPATRLRFTQTELSDSSFVDSHPLLAPNPADGVDLIVDTRETNAGSTENRGADIELNYRYSSRFGLWFATLRHNYVARNTVRESSFCDGGACFTVDGDRQNTQPVDTVGTLDGSLNLISVAEPLPEHRSSLIITWSLRGLDVTVDTTFTSETSIISEKKLTEFNPATFQPIVISSVIERTTVPAQSVNLRVGYDFSGGLFSVPGWLESTQVSLTVTSLYARKSGIEDRVISSSFEGLVPFEELSNLVHINPRGRTLILNFSTTF